MDSIPPPKIFIPNKHKTDDIVIPDEDNYPLLSCDLPQHSYHQSSKLHCIPFNEVTSNNGKFTTLLDAMIYVRNHILNHGFKFSRQLARIYIISCYIYDPSLDSYISLENLSKKEFETAFQQARSK